MTATSSQKLVALDDDELKSMRAITTNAQSEAMKKRKASSRSSNEEESKFRFEKEHLGKQYSSLYYQRLMVLLPGLKQSAREKFGTSVPLKRVIELGAAGANTDNNKEDGKGGGEKKESSAMMMMDVDDEDTLLQEQENKEKWDLSFQFCFEYSYDTDEYKCYSKHFSDEIVENDFAYFIVENYERSCRNVKEVLKRRE